MNNHSTKNGCYETLSKLAKKNAKMNHIMKEYISIPFIICFLFTSSFPCTDMQIPRDEQLIKVARMLILNNKWGIAIEKLNILLETYPKSAWISQALFNRAICLEKRQGMELQSLNDYSRYLKCKNRNVILDEVADCSIIDISLKLYEKGYKSYLAGIEERLYSKNSNIRLYAAYKVSLSDLKHDTRISAKASSVLKKLMSKEAHDYYGIVAKMAFLRMNPFALNELQGSRDSQKLKILHIGFFHNDKEGPIIVINMPLVLAHLALDIVSHGETSPLIIAGTGLNEITKKLKELNLKQNAVVIGKLAIKIWIDSAK